MLHRVGTDPAEVPGELIWGGPSAELLGADPHRGPQIAGDVFEALPGHSDSRHALVTDSAHQAAAVDSYQGAGRSPQVTDARWGP
jgi:hypothetical protein